MRSSSIFSWKMTMTSNFTISFVSQISISKFSWQMQEIFKFSYDSCCCFLNNFYFFKNNYLHFACSLKDYFLKQNQDIFFFLRIKNIKTNSFIIFLKLFQIIFFWRKIYSLPLILIYKRFNFCYYFSMFSYFFIM